MRPLIELSAALKARVRLVELENRDCIRKDPMSGAGSVQEWVESAVFILADEVALRHNMGAFMLARADINERAGHLVPRTWAKPGSPLAGVLAELVTDMVVTWAEETGHPVPATPTPWEHPLVPEATTYEVPEGKMLEVRSAMVVFNGQSVTTYPVDDDGKPIVVEGGEAIAIEPGGRIVPFRRRSEA